MEFQQIRKGSTRTLILSLLTEEAKYGYQIARELERRSEGYFEVSEGLMYPTLHQMEREGLLQAEWQTPAGKRRRKYYTITPKGRRQLRDSVVEWKSFIKRFVDFMGEFDVWPESVPG
jgi:DNA-binding PadR family transcriptional regulator